MWYRRLDISSLDRMIYNLYEAVEGDRYYMRNMDIFQ